MKTKLSALLVFLLLAVVLAFGAYAENSIKIIVNGEEVSSDVQPFIKDGRTMVPLRVVSEALGADVSWDQETRTVTIVSKTTDPEVEPPEPPPVENDLTKDRINLSELKPVYETPGRVFYKSWGDNPEGPRGAFSIYDKKYFDGIGMLNYQDSKGSVEVQFDIKDQFKKLTATVGASDIGSSGYRGKTRLQVYGDDQLLYNSEAFSHTNASKDIDINISGVKTLRLVSFSEQGVGAHDAVWANIMLHKKF